jgi:hypothetical protein
MRRQQRNRRVTQQYDNGDSGHQDIPFSHKEITSIFMGGEFAQATPLSLRQAGSSVKQRNTIRYSQFK